MHKHGFIREHYYAFAFLYRIIDLVIIALSLRVAVDYQGQEFTYHYVTLALTSVLVYLYLSDLMGLYRSWRGDTFFHLVLATLSVWGSSFLVLLLIAFFTTNLDIFSQDLLISWFIGALFSFNIWRLGMFVFLKYIRLQGRNTRSYAIIGGTDAGVKLHDYISSHPELGLQFKGFYDDRRSSRLPCERVGTFDDAINLAREGGVDQLYITLTLKAEERINQIILKCGDTTCDVYMVPDLLTLNLMNSRVHHMGGQVSLSVFESPYMSSYRPVKRSIDIIFSVLILSLITIPMLFIAAAIKLTGGGPVIFKQRRYGLGGKPIEVWKFRTMTTAENGSNVVQATRNDPRITRLGAFLRKYSLDELPQFINVLKGDMSIVGPRPHAVAHNEEYRQKVTYYMLRHKVKPGITGWAQINGWRGETDTLDKMQQRIEHDLEYIRRWSPWFDIKIIFLTIFKGFTDDNVY